MKSAARARRESENALPVVVALIPANDARPDITRSLRGIARAVFCARADDAEQLVAEREAHAVLAAVTDSNRQAVARLVERVRLQFPQMPIVVVLAPDALAADAERALGRIPGITDALAADYALIRRRIATLLTFKLHRAKREEMAARLAAAVPISAKDVVRYAIEHGHRPSSVRDLATAIGVPRKTMDRRLSKAIPVTARQLIGWGRLIAVAMQLESTVVSVDAVAVELQFSSPSALRNLLQRYAGLTPTQLRRVGGPEYLVERLHAQIVG